MSYKDLTPEDKIEIVKLYMRGNVKQSDLARMYGCAQSSISNLLLRIGARKTAETTKNEPEPVAPKKWSPITDDERSEIMRLYHGGGLTQKEIADKIGRSETSVWKTISSRTEANAHDVAVADEGSETAVRDVNPQTDERILGAIRAVSDELAALRKQNSLLSDALTNAIQGLEYVKRDVRRITNELTGTNPATASVKIETVGINGSSSRSSK